MFGKFQLAMTVTILLSLASTLVADVPSGTYTSSIRGQELSMILDMGNVTVHFGDKLAVKGTYKITKDQIEFTDVEGPQACKGDIKTGSYKWKLNGDKLTFTNVNDKCEGRRIGLTSPAWSKADASANSDKTCTEEEAALDSDTEKSSDLMALQGKWFASEGFESDMSITFDGENFALADGERKVTGTIRIDESKAPKSMDLTVTGGSATREVERFKGKTARAIYELKGGRLKWCANEPGKEGRPTKFARDGGGELQVLFIVFERKND